MDSFAAAGTAFTADNMYTGSVSCTHSQAMRPCQGRSPEMKQLCATTNEGKRHTGDPCTKPTQRLRQALLIHHMLTGCRTLDGLAGHACYPHFKAVPKMTEAAHVSTSC